VRQPVSQLTLQPPAASNQSFMRMIMSSVVCRFVNFSVGTTVRQADVQMIYYPLQHKGPTMNPTATVNDIVLYEDHMVRRKTKHNPSHFRLNDTVPIFITHSQRRYYPDLILQSKPHLPIRIDRLDSPMSM
jgi:hypothetical protein